MDAWMHGAAGMVAWREGVSPSLFHAACPPQLSRPGHHPSHPQWAAAARPDRRQAAGALASAAGLARAANGAGFLLEPIPDLSFINIAESRAGQPRLATVPRLSRTASATMQVLEYRLTETLPLLSAMSLDLARLCRPRRSPQPAHPRGTAASRRTKANSRERQVRT